VKSTVPLEVLPSQENELPRDEIGQFVYGLIEVDPEIIEALEEEGDEFEELPDDFIKLANLEELPEDVEEWRANREDDDEESEEESEGEDEDEEEPKRIEREKYDNERFTEQRSILEERFEKVNILIF
jgi:hypothetical protein